MLRSQFLCLAVSRREGGNCIAGIDLGSGKWIRPISARTHGALADHEIIVTDGGTQKHRILEPLDVLNLRLNKYVGNKVQPENWQMVLDAYTVLRRYDVREDIEMLTSFSDKCGPLLHSYSERIPADDPLIKHGLSHSVSMIRPEQLHWKVTQHPIYSNKLKVQAEFRFYGDSYCLVTTDPAFEAQCGRSGMGRHPHSKIVGNAKEQVLLTISLTEVPLHGYHYKLVAGVVRLPTQE